MAFAYTVADLSKSNAEFFANVSYETLGITAGDIENLFEIDESNVQNTDMAHLKNVYVAALIYVAKDETETLGEWLSWCYSKVVEFCPSDSVKAPPESGSVVEYISHFTLNQLMTIGL